jgi:hypothetical protein
LQNKKNSCKKHETAIATKNQLQNTQVKKVRLQKKPVQKKAPWHDTIRLRLGWCLLDVVATW